MSQSPLRAEGSKGYSDAWRAINILIRSDGTWSGRERNLCFRNRGDGTFDDISFASGLDLDADGRAFVPLDLDADGDLDIVLKNRNGRQLRAFRNDLRAGPARHLTVRLQGRASNRDGVGGRVWVETDRHILMREVVSGSGYISQRSRVARFGLRDGEAVRAVRVRWPLGSEQHFRDVPRSGTVLAVEGESQLRDAERPRPGVVESEGARRSSPADSPGVRLAVPVPAPEYELRDVLDGTSILRLSDSRGRRVLVNFWATWCPPCRHELALLQDRLPEFERLGIEIQAVSVDGPESSDAVRELALELRLGFPVLIADRQTAEAYSVLSERLFDRRRPLAIPTSFVLDRQGRIVTVYRGEVDPGQILRQIESPPNPALPFAGRWVSSGPRRDFEDLGSAFAERGLGATALRMFGGALAQGGRTPRLLNNMAGALIAGGDPLQGEALLREALAADAAMTDAKVNLASLLVQRGEGAEAETLLEEVLSRQPSDPQALSVLGSLQFARGRPQAAEALFRRAAESNPDDARLHENLGASLASQGRFDEGLRHYETARELGASGSLLHTNLAVLYMQTGQAEKGLRSFLDAVDADPTDPAAHLNLARFRLQASDSDGARNSIRRALELAPGDPSALVLEARALVLEGRRDEARDTLRDILQMDPSHSEATELLRSLR